MMTKAEDFADVLNSGIESAFVSATPELVPRPSFPASAMACVVLDNRNQVIWSDTKFEQWIGFEALDFQICDDLRDTLKPEVIHVSDRNGRPIILIYALAKIAADWPVILPGNRKSLFTSKSIAVGALSLANLSDDIFLKARALGFTNLEARVSTALVAHGSLRQAAAHSDVTYNTARSAISDAMKKSGASNQTQLVRKLSALATSVIPPRQIAEQVLIDIFDLTLREAQLTLLLTEGHSRNNTAAIAGLSKSVAKDSYSRIFEKLGVSKTPELPRIVMDAFTAALIAQQDVPIVAAPATRTPLRLFQREDNGLIAVSDYGSVEKTPVLILHSSLSTRHPFRKLVRALQDAGFRPITMDRPGFGLTDNLPATADPFNTGSDDIAYVCKKMGIHKIHMITRGGAFAALAFARAYPDLVDRVVVINPDLLQHGCSRRQGTFGIIRTGFDKFPDRIEGLARWAAGQLTKGWTDKMIQHAVRDSKIDTRAFEDPEALEDYRKSIMVFGSGRLSGFIREQRGYALMKDVAAMVDASNWTLLIGETDPIHNTSDILEFWQHKAPNARILRPENAGRYMSLTHTKSIVTALES